MKLKEFKIVLAVILAPLFVLWGCKTSKPLSPVKIVNLGVSVSAKNIRASLLNSTADVFYYNISGPLASPVTGMVGPISSTTGSGTDTFTITGVPTGPGEILSIQMDDTTGDVLGIGAASLADVQGGISVDLGSVVRSCYEINLGSACYYGVPDREFNFNEYQFGSYEYTSGSGTSSDPDTFDIGMLALSDPDCTGAYDLVDGWTGSNASIAYLGNGQLVNFDYVPADSAFFSDAIAAKSFAEATDTTVDYQDVYCIKLQGGTSAGHAWMQITSSTPYVYDFPTFIFRLRNDSTPYYLYDTTLNDITQYSCDGD